MTTVVELENVDQDHCKYLILEDVPQELYFDLDELRAAVPFGGVVPVSPSWHIDVERPSSASTQHLLGFLVQKQQLQGRTLRVKVPVHLRYQAPVTSDEGEGYAHSILPPPRLLKSCGGMPWTEVHIENVAASSSPSGTLVKGCAGSLQLSVPVGLLRHRSLVSKVTLFVSAAAALAISYTSKATATGQSK